jgi:hypothetical protein
MYQVTLVKEIFVVVVHGEGGFVDPRESESRVFVCGSLMDPAFVAGMVGHEVAIAPAVAKGFIRSWGEADGKKFHFLRRGPEGMVPGVILLGLSEADILNIEEFEQAPRIRCREDITVVVGDITLPAHTYLKKD